MLEIDLQATPIFCIKLSSDWHSFLLTENHMFISLANDVTNNSFSAVYRVLLLPGQRLHDQRERAHQVFVGLCQRHLLAYHYGSIPDRNAEHRYWLYQLLGQTRGVFSYPAELLPVPVEP